MADAMPGLAGLPPQAAAQAPAGPAEMTPENLAVFEQMRQEIPPSEFSEDLLSTAAEADPMAVAEFKAELRGLELPPEALDVLNQMVDEVLASPDRYPEIRAKYLAQDIPEEMLPPTFDPEFFGALNLAVDEIRATGGSQLPPQGFAQGGLATLKPMAAAMAQQGRYGDTMLAHISPREARMLRQMGGSGTTNPNTGLPEFFLKGLFKGIKKGLSKVARAAKKFVRSKVGRIVTTLALAFVLGPAAATAIGVTSTAGVAAVAGFVGSAGSTALAGGNLKESLKAGAIGGLVGGAGAGVFGGAEAFQAGSYTGPTTISGQIEKATDFLTGGGQEAALPDPAQAATEAVQEATVSPAVDTSAGITRTPLPGVDAPPVPTSAIDQATQLAMQTEPGAAGIGSLTEAGVAAPSSAAQKLGSMVGVPEGAQLVPAQAPQSLVQRGLDKILPGRIQEAADIKAQALGQEAFQDTLTDFANAGVTQGAPGFDLAVSEAIKAKNAAITAGAKVGPLAKYGPLAATGLGVMGLTGGFKAEEPQIPEGFEGIMGTPGMDLLRQYPDIYGLRFGGVQPMTTTTPYQTYAPRPVGAAKGGSMDRNKFPRKNGAINGPGTGTSDDIPAMLSDGEFVFTARAVRGMGDGSRRQGAKRMYAMMKKLENRANG
jgi:hypothetical protein